MPRRFQNGLLAMLTTLYCLAEAPAVRAQAVSTFDFAWDAPEGCPPAGAVGAEIDALLGGPARERVREALAVYATVERRTLWQVTLRTTSGETRGHRLIEAATCAGLANATALIVALMIDPDAVAAQANKANASGPMPPAPPPVQPPVSAPAPRATLVLAGVGAALGFGVLPAHLAVARPPFRVELRGVYGLSNARSDSPDGEPNAHGEFRFHAATLAVCRTWSASFIDWGPCAGMEAGLVRGRGVGASQTSAEDTPWFALGAGGLVAFKLAPWLRLPLRADAMVPLWRPEFVFRNVASPIDSPIFRSWPVGARLSASAELQF
jgi:hypothetical protein